VKLCDKPFLCLTAEDLMSQDVITIPAEMSLRAAALRLSRAQVSGAPVVDEESRCVGVLSTSDFLKLAGNPAQGRASSCFCSEWQVHELESLPEDSVQRYMTRDPVTVESGALLPELVRIMLDAHIHRVLVVDAETHPIGIVYTTDILAAVARTPSEMTDI
jgi:CBS-domain-containing membrane protein